MWMSEFLICKIFWALGCWSHWRGCTGNISALPTSRWWWWISFLHDMFLVVSDGWWPVSSEDGSMGANQGRRLRPVRLAMDWIVIHVLKKVTIRKKRSVLYFLVSIILLPTCMSMPVPSPMNRFWKYLHGDLHIVKFRMQVRCSCSVCHQHNILSQYLSRDKYETKITCHSLSCLFFLLVFLCSDQTRIYLHILLWAGEVLKDCPYHAMLWLDQTRVSSQVKSD